MACNDHALMQFAVRFYSKQRNEFHPQVRTTRLASLIMSESSSAPSYARPTKILPPPSLDKYNYPGVPVELDSVYPPPPEILPSPLPRLPSGQRKPIWDGDSRIPYSLTTHIVPAAYLCEDEDVELPEMPLPAPSSQSRSAASSKEERKSFVAKAEEKLREIRRGYEDSGRKAQKKRSYGCA